MGVQTGVGVLTGVWECEQGCGSTNGCESMNEGVRL